MNIKKASLKFGSMKNRTKTTLLVLHHAAAKICSVETVHQWHKNNGWSGIGYHFLVRKDGTIYEGRPINKVGAHAYGFNSSSIGICFEGNFETEKMTAAQKKAGKELVTYVRQQYPTITKVVGHRDLMATACPGKNFPFDEIAKGATVKKKKYSGKLPTIKIAYYTTNKEGNKVKKYRTYLQNGDEGTAVKQWQDFLKWYGYDLEADGDFGDITEKYTKEFQKAVGLKPDGYPGKDTIAKAKKVRK